MEAHEREEGLSKLKVPAIGIIITGIIGLLNGLYSAATFNATMEMQEKMVNEAMEDAQNQNPDVDIETQQEMTNLVMEWTRKLGMPAIIIGILGAAFVTLGGFKMMQGQSKGLATMACILSFIPVLSPCCILGLVFGIWGLVAMGKPEVKAVFDAAA